MQCIDSTKKKKKTLGSSLTTTSSSITIEMLSGLKWMAPVVSGTTDRSAKGVSAVSSSSSPCKDVTQSFFVKPKYIIYFY